MLFLVSLFWLVTRNLLFLQYYLSSDWSAGLWRSFSFSFFLGLYLHTYFLIGFKTLIWLSHPFSLVFIVMCSFRYPSSDWLPDLCYSALSLILLVNRLQDCEAHCPKRKCSGCQCTNYNGKHFYTWESQLFIIRPCWNTVLYYREKCTSPADQIQHPSTPYTRPIVKLLAQLALLIGDPPSL